MREIFTDRLLFRDSKGLLMMGITIIIIGGTERDISKEAVHQVRYHYLVHLIIIIPEIQQSIINMNNMIIKDTTREVIPTTTIFLTLNLNPF